MLTGNPVQRKQHLASNMTTFHILSAEVLANLKVRDMSIPFFLCEPYLTLFDMYLQ